MKCQVARGITVFCGERCGWKASVDEAVAVWLLSPSARMRWFVLTATIPYKMTCGVNLRPTPMLPLVSNWNTSIGELISSISQCKLEVSLEDRLLLHVLRLRTWSKALSALSCELRASTPS